MPARCQLHSRTGDLMDTTLVLLFWIVCAFVTAGIYTSKGRSAVGGFLLGLVLGIFGVIIAAVQPANTTAIETNQIMSGQSEQCPYCKEIVKAGALVCKHCGRNLPSEN